MDFGQAASAPVQHYPRQLFYLFPKECKRQFSGGSHHGSLDQLKSWIKTERSTSCPEQSLYFLEHATNSQKVFLTIGVILMTVFGASALMAAETGRTKEIITLRGIPFDKPGVKDDVIKRCD